jgi:YVTN family beta-propeller protein
VGLCLSALALQESERGAAEAKPELSSLVFVANRDSNDVAVIDVRTDRIIKRFRVGAAPHMTIVGRSALTYTTGTGSNDLTILDASNLEVVGRVPLPGKGPEHGTISPDGARVYVANVEGNSVAVVDAASRRAVGLIQGLDHPHNIVISPDGTKAYVAQAGARALAVVNTARLKVVKRIPVGTAQRGQRAGQGHDQGVNGAVLIPGTPLLAATHTGSGELALVDIRSDRLEALIKVGAGPWEPYGTPDGKYVLTPNNGDKTVSVVDVAARKVVARLPGGADMTGIVTTADGRKAYVISRGDSTVTVIDLTRRLVAKVIPVGTTPEVATRTAGGKVYVASSGSGTVSVIDPARDEVVRTIGDVGKFPWALSSVGGSNYCH